MNRTWIAMFGLLSALAGCGKPEPQVLGTLEWDRISVPAPVAERIVRIDVREGQQVAAGAPLLHLEAIRSQAQLDTAQAQLQQRRDVLAELQAGPRVEDIAQARANLSAAQAQAANASAYYRRLQPLGQRKLVAAAEVDRARAALGLAQGQVHAAQAALDELRHGTRPEQVAQGQAATDAAQAQATLQAANLGKLTVVAPRAGRVDSLPYRLGDQATVGAPLVILLVGDAPYARVYVPERMRAGIKPGQSATVYVDGRPSGFPAHVRMIRSEPVFTPYYALSGDEVERLSYLAEIVFDRPADLPAGVPVHVTFAGDAGGH